MRHVRQIQLTIDVPVYRLLENEATDANEPVLAYINRVLRAAVGLDDLIDTGPVYVPEPPRKKRGMGALSPEERRIVALKIAESKRRNAKARQAASVAVETRRTRPE